jgi:hypothetical protein
MVRKFQLIPLPVSIKDKLIKIKIASHINSRGWPRKQIQKITLKIDPVIYIYIYIDAANCIELPKL